MKLKSFIGFCVVLGLVMIAFLIITLPQSSHIPESVHKEQNVGKSSTEIQHESSLGGRSSPSHLTTSNQQSVKRPMDNPDRSQLIDIAYKSLAGNVDIPVGSEATVEYKGDVAIITWPVMPNPGEIARPRADYYGRVEVDVPSREIVSILVGS